MNLYRNNLLRRLFLPLFSRFNFGDIRIRHHWTGEKILLHSFRHKGYWFHGRRREYQTMACIGGIIRESDTVLDVGGHIGYFALYFARLASAGRVHVFEPGPNNLPYIRENIGKNGSIRLEEAGVGSEAGKFQLHVENLTGQNNSFVADYHMFGVNRANAYSDISVESVEVEVVTLDAYCAVESICPNFIKIDVEGFELEVLRGATRVLAEDRPVLMVEVSCSHPEVFQLLKEAGYCTFDEDLKRIDSCDSMDMNTFCFPEELAEARLARARLSKFYR